MQGATESPDTRPHPTEQEEAFDHLSFHSDSFNSRKECACVRKTKEIQGINN